MRFVCFVYENADEMAARTDEVEREITREHLDYDNRLRAGGHFIDAAALQSPPKSKVVRKRDGRTIATDGPYIETKEHIGGFIYIEAPNMEKAVELAAGIPSARICAIEVRPIRDLNAEIAAAPIRK
jgi:hypothetical protein